MNETTHKIVYLANHYPKKKITEIAAMFSLPALEANVAIWRAQDLKYLTVNDEDKTFTVDEVPDDWAFGEPLRNLMNHLVYAMHRLAKDETDIEENFLMNWLAGYPTHDVFIAINYLKDTGVLATYVLDDKKDKSKYTFYTLKENADKKWGRKQFVEPAKASKAKAKK